MEPQTLVTVMADRDVEIRADRHGSTAGRVFLVVGTATLVLTDEQAADVISALRDVTAPTG